MKYTLQTIRRIEVDIINENGSKEGKAFLYFGNGWLIFNNEYQTVGKAKKKSDIVREYVTGKDKAFPLPSQPVCPNAG